MQALELEIKQLLIEALNLEDMTPEQIKTDEALFVKGLGLDSIDALELGLALQKRYGVHMSADSEETRAHFASIQALAQFVSAQRAR